MTKRQQDLVYDWAEGNISERGAARKLNCSRSGFRSLTMQYAKLMHNKWYGKS